MLNANIQNFSYVKKWHEELECFAFSDINALPSKCIAEICAKRFALAKWVSPKRTRSYPYARVYDAFDAPANKVVSVIPLIKDEGSGGDMDYLQWDTVALMSLLNVYVVLGFYDRAEVNERLENKITNQKFNNDFVKNQLESLANYRQSALHWNLNCLESANLAALISHTKNAYKNIAKSLNIELHAAKNIDNFAEKITRNRESFMKFSRGKAKMAQHREIRTIHPKERVGVGEKVKIVIENYLGGRYFFTIDDVFVQSGVLFLCEGKHAKSALLPSNDDIKDGLLKLMLYNNLAKIEGFECFKVVLRLTSGVLREGISLPTTAANLDSFAVSNRFLPTQTAALVALNAESRANNFEVWISGESF